MNNYKIGAFFTSIGVLIFAVLFFLVPDVMTDGLRNGLNICGSAVIPSLFMFMVLSDFIVRSGFAKIVGGSLSGVVRFLFRLPGVAGCAVLMSLIGGFPVGARMTAQLYENGEITQKHGQRMMLFCVNAGPAFVIGTVGVTMLSSRKAGIILFASLTVTSLLGGIATGLFSGKPKEYVQVEDKSFNLGVINESVNQTVQAMLGICGWILVFSGINAFIKCIPIKSAVPWLLMTSEVTNGCITATESFPTCVLALVIGWAGLAVHCQLMPYLQSVKIKISHFWVARLLSGGTATAIAYLLFKAFPCEIDVFSAGTTVTAELYSISAPVAAAMFALSSLMLVDIKSCTKGKAVI